MRQIPLRNKAGQVIARAVIDNVDAAWGSLRWHLNRDGYVVRNYKANGKWGVMFLHREIMRAPTGIEVDHKDGNPLNNRRRNLRLVTRAQQVQNVAAFGASQYRGVSLYRRKGRSDRWRARVTINGKMRTVGYFVTEEDAGRAAAAARSANMTHNNESRH